MNNFWNTVLYHNTIKEWLICIAIISGILLLLRGFQAIVVKRLRAIAERTENTIDDFILSVVQSGLMPMLYILAFFIGLKYIDLPARGSKVIHIAIMLVATFFCVKILTSFIAYGFSQALSRNDPDASRQKQAKGILLIIQAFVWVIGILFLVDNFGYNVTTLIAGLGIGGIAIALAAQTILGDLFSYLVIFFDKPFEIGDFITVGDKMGTVQYIGVKTTRLKTISGEQLICSNTDLTSSRVHNFKRMEDRRIAFSFGIEYTTPAAKLKLLPIKIREMIEGIEDLKFDRAHFKSLADYSLVFEVVYIVLSPDYNLYMDRQQTLNLALMQMLEEEEIAFAFPPQTLTVSKKEIKETIVEEKEGKKRV